MSEEQKEYAIDYIMQLQEENYKLKQENKQLKEELDVHKILLQTNAPSTCILTELEEWLKEEGNNGIDEWGNHYTVCLYKLNKLKEKYK